MSEPVKKLEAIFSALLPNESVPPRHMTKLNCAGWDSLFKMSLIVSIEQEFKVTIADEKAIELNSFDSALAIIERC